MKLTLAFLMLLFLSACSIGSTVMTGPATDPMEVTKVSIVYQAPACDFETVANIDISGGYFSRASLIDGFRERAGALGASIVQVLYIQTIGSNEYFGSARALRCH